MNWKIASIVAMTVVNSISPVWAENNWLLEKAKTFKDNKLNSITQTKLSDTKIGDGLKEALRVGITNTIRKTGQNDGFLKNEAIKIQFPENLRTLEKGLRAVGMNKPLDEFVLSMNRSAEKAVPLASGIFTDAIFNMSIQDARKILNGSDSAVTSYFKDKTYQKLKQAFIPMIEKSLGEYDITKKYNHIVGRYNALPMVKKVPAFDPKEYVLNKSLDGLFFVLAEEETKIRKDPSARVTDLLKQVFK